MVNCDRKSEEGLDNSESLLHSGAFVIFLYMPKELQEPAFTLEDHRIQALRQLPASKVVKIDGAKYVVNHGAIHVQGRRGHFFQIYILPATSDGAIDYEEVAKRSGQRNKAKGFWDIIYDLDGNFYQDFEGPHGMSDLEFLRAICN